MDGKVGEVLGGTGIETPDGVVPLEEVPGDIGAESQTVLHQRSVVEDEVGVEVEVLDEEERETGTVTMITGGYHHLEGIVILRLPGVVGVVAGSVGAAGEGQETQDLVVRPAEASGMIERRVDLRGTREGGYCVKYSDEVDYTTIFDYKTSSAFLSATAREWGTTLYPGHVVSNQVRGCNTGQRLTKKIKQIRILSTKQTRR